jgi:hypothetical protein
LESSNFSEQLLLKVAASQSSYFGKGQLLGAAALESGSLSKQLLWKVTGSWRTSALESDLFLEHLLLDIDCFLVQLLWKVAASQSS